MRVQAAETSIGMLGRVQLGDGQEWIRFARHCREIILSWCRWKKISTPDAEDLVQDSLVVVVSRIESFRRTGTGSLRAWLRAIAWRCRCDAIDKAEDMDRLKTLAARYREASEDIALLEQEFERLHEIDCLERCMAIVKRQVPPTIWRAFQLQFLEEQSGISTARQLGITADRAHAAKSRVVRLIRAEMKKLTF
ncbi:MAG: hypothetical protein RLZZ232_976 [Planctomycetota bacterium]|jgi:RNA polymerase sigma factor (sigma-70 family)